MQQPRGLGHLARFGMIDAAEIRKRQHAHARVASERSGRLRGQMRQLRQLLCVHLDIHGAVGEEIGAVFHDHHVHAIDMIMHTGGIVAEHLQQRPQHVRVMRGAPRKQAIGKALAHQHGSEHVDVVAQRLGRIVAQHTVTLAVEIIGIGQAVEAGILDRRVNAFDAADIQLVAGADPPESVGTADEDRLGNAIFLHLDRGANHGFVLALRKHEADRVLTGLVDNQAHEQARAVDARGQLLAVGANIGQRPAGHTGFGGSPGHGGRHDLDQARIKGLGQDVIRPETQFLDAIGLQHRRRHLLAGQLGQRMHGGNLHLLIEGRGPGIERAAEQKGEAQHVVDLVRVIRASRGHDQILARGHRQIIGDLRIGIGHGEHDRALGHGFQHLGRDDVALGEADEYIGADHRLLQRPFGPFAGKVGLVRRQLIAAVLADHALAIEELDVFMLRPQLFDQLHAGKAGCAGAEADDAHILDPLVLQQQRVQKGGGHDHGGAVLIIVQHRNVHALLQLFLDDEAFRRLDVLEVDAAEGRFHARDGFDELHRVGFIQLDIEDVDVGKTLEQHALAFHDRLAGQRADVAQAEYRRAVADDADQIGPRGVFVGQLRVLFDLQAGLGHARGVGQRQVALRQAGLGRPDADLARCGRAVILEGFLAHGFLWHSRS